MLKEEKFLIKHSSNRISIGYFMQKVIGIALSRNSVGSPITSWQSERSVLFTCFKALTSFFVASALSSRLDQSHLSSWFTPLKFRLIEYESCRDKRLAC